MSEPEFSFGKGRHQIKLKGNEAIHEGGWSIRFLLAMRGVAMVLAAVAAIGASLGVAAIVAVVPPSLQICIPHQTLLIGFGQLSRSDTIHNLNSLSSACSTSSPGAIC
jgi:hypothetical protein